MTEHLNVIIDFLKEWISLIKAKLFTSSLIPKILRKTTCHLLPLRLGLRFRRKVKSFYIICYLCQ